MIIEAQFFVVAKGLETDLRTTEGFHIKHYCTVMYKTLSIEYSTIKLILNTSKNLYPDITLFKDMEICIVYMQFPGLFLQ